MKYKLKVSEKDLQKTIIDYLLLKKAVVVKVNNGGVFDFKRQVWRKQREKGISDILACYKGYFLAIEVKSTGAKPSPDQEDFLQRVIKAGGHAIWTDNFEKVEEMIKRI